MREKNLLNRILLAVSTGPCRLWRNNVGRAWIGSSIVKGPRQSVSLGPNDVLIRNARPLNAGLTKGASDLIGFTTVDGAALFTAIEAKTPGVPVSEDQARFIACIQEAGGIAGVARTPDEARGLVCPD